VLAAYPDHPVKVIVPYPPGGPADVTARLIFNKVGEKLGQPFLIDNRGGAGGNIGTVASAQAPPDGYTVSLITPAQVINMTLYSHPGYDMARDFVPVSLFSTAPGLLLANPKLGVSTFAEMVALAKSKPGQLSFASQGVGVAPHMMMEMIKKRTGINMVHVPYRGSAPALNDLLAGNVPLMMDSIVTGLPHVKSGALRGLAVSTGRARRWHLKFPPSPSPDCRASTCRCGTASSRRPGRRPNWSRPWARPSRRRFSFRTFASACWRSAQRRPIRPVPRRSRPSSRPKRRNGPTRSAPPASRCSRAAHCAGAVRDCELMSVL
jgi:hypothetical protein